MKFHELTVCNIGPFLGSSTIDFDTLTESGLFLLDGPTGSGKSTIMKAIIHALYGTVERNLLSSIHVTDGSASTVTLTFSVGDTRYRITRTMPRKKPGRATVPSEKVELIKIDDDTTTPLADRPSDVANAIQRIIGLTADQFEKTIMLPQGKFAEFLTAKTNERTALLRSIFGTENYTSFQEFLKARADESGISLANSLSQLEAQLATVREYDYAPLKSIDILPENNEHYCDRDVWASESTVLTTAMDDAVAELNAAAQKARATQEQADTALVEGERCATNAATYARLTEEKTALESLREAITADRDSCEAYTRAKDIAVERDRSLMAATAASDAREAWEAQCALVTETDAALAHPECGLEKALHDGVALLPQLDPDEPTSNERFTRKSEAWAAARAQAGRQSTDARDITAKIDALATTLERTRADIAETTAHLATLEEDIASSTAEIATLTEQIEGYGEIDVNGAAQAVAAATEALANAKETSELTSQLTEQREVRTGAVAGANEARAAKEAAFNAYVSGIVPLLAGQLEEGCACPVCGSLDHPTPATTTTQTMSEEEYRQAEAEAERTEAALKKIDLEIERLVARLATRTTDAPDVATATAALEAAQKAHDDAQAALDARTAAEKRLDKARTTLQEKTATREAEKATLAQLTARLAEDTASHTALTDKRAAIIAPYTSVDELDTALETITDSWQPLDALWEALCSTTAARHEKARLYKEARDNAGFDTDDAVKAALAIDYAAVSERVTSWDKDMSAVSAQLENPELKAAAEAPAPDLDALREAAATAREAAKASADLASRTDEQATTLRKQCASITTLVAHISGDRERSLMLRYLSNIAEGKTENLLQIKLETYVLMSRFEEIVERANVRLMEISQARYSLHRVDETSRRDRVKGLGLTIIDYAVKSGHDGSETTNGVARSVDSLSGGEKFYVSLALALALAEVVQEENGSIRMETLLIDEGFGSLDKNTLETVMASLNDLRERGRTIGVISHVSELRERILSRLEIRSTKNYTSTITLVTP